MKPTREARPEGVSGASVRRSWGGPRAGAGRPRRGARRRVPHVVRPWQPASFPLHVTLRLVDGLPTLRSKKLGRVIFAAFAVAKSRLGLRVTHFSIQSNHIHLIAEVSDDAALSRGMQGLGIRLAKRLNSCLRRKGRVFADRYHATSLTSPRQVRNAIRYVMNNHRRHHLSRGGGPPPDWADPFSSVDYFDGFRRLPSGTVPVAEFALGRDPPVSKARTWLLSRAWRARGLLDVWEVPGPRRP